jgi:DHA1 family bicyclomycin/chloramphenicol resistance-like MFS transporter
MLRYALLLGFLTLIGPLGIDMYLPAFSAIASDFDAAEATVQLSLVSYLVALSLGQAVYGPLADRFGRRGPLLCGLLLCLGSCVGAVFAASIQALILLRFLQGAGACACVVIARAIARDIGEGEQVARLIAMMAIVQAVSPMLAPVLGGVLLLEFSWRGVFVVTAAMAASATYLVVRVLGETLPFDKRAKGLATAFARYGHLWKDRHYLLVIFAGGFASGGFFAYLSGSSFVIVTLFGFSPQEYGLFFGFNAMVMLGAAQLSSRLVRRTGETGLIRAITLAYAASATILLVTVVAGLGAVWFFSALVSCLVCQGMIFPITVLRALGPYAHAAGAASAMLGVVQYACGAFSSAFVSGLADGTALPMTGAMLACAVLACGLTWVAGPDKT